MSKRLECIGPLVRAGISEADALALRRIAMTLHRWHELECGTDYGCIERDEKWAIERCAHPPADRVRWWDGAKWVERAARRTYTDHEHDEMMTGLPTDRSWDSADFARAEAQGFPSQGAWRQTGEKPYWLSSRTSSRSPMADREAGAKRRLAAIMAKYPTLRAYIQTDPRGAALYILRPGDVPEGAEVDSYYSRGLAVYQ